MHLIKLTLICWFCNKPCKIWIDVSSWIYSYLIFVIREHQLIETSVSFRKKVRLVLKFCFINYYVFCMCSLHSKSALYESFWENFEAFNNATFPFHYTKLVSKSRELKASSFWHGCDPHLQFANFESHLLHAANWDSVTA